MPEGPEIRIAADRVNAAVGGKTTERVRFGLERLLPFEEELSGRRVEDVTSRGKAMLTRFEGGRVLYSHNQLYGKWLVCRPDRPPQTGRSLRVSIETDAKWAQLYSASEIEVLWEEDLEQHPFLQKLGPDLLDAGTTPARIAKRIQDPRFARKRLGGLLLEQGFLAGVGNYLRSEILFFAGLPPERRPSDLHEDEVRRLAKAAREVTRRTYRTQGTTETPDHVRRAKAAGQPRRLWRHAVFYRDGESCRRCGDQVTREEFAGRRLYRCPTCQAG